MSLPKRAIDTPLQNSCGHHEKINLVLDNYDDLFSDFDPRPYTERALSDDFLRECKKALKDKEHTLQNIEMHLLLPHKIRIARSEANIKKRLMHHFQKHFHEAHTELNQLYQSGVFMLIIGGIMIIMATFYDSDKPLLSFLIVLFEPIGWFSLWTALDKLFRDVKEIKPESDFYRKMSQADIIFNTLNPNHHLLHKQSAKHMRSYS